MYQIESIRSRQTFPLGKKILEATNIREQGDPAAPVTEDIHKQCQENHRRGFNDNSLVTAHGSTSHTCIWVILS